MVDTDGSGEIDFHELRRVTSSVGHFTTSTKLTGEAEAGGNMLHRAKSTAAWTRTSTSRPSDRTLSTELTLIVETTDRIANDQSELVSETSSLTMS